MARTSAPDASRPNALKDSFIRNLRTALRQSYEPQSGNLTTRKVAVIIGNPLLLVRKGEDSADSRATFKAKQPPDLQDR